MKLKIAVFAFMLEILVISSILILNDSYVLMKIQLPLMLVFGYLSSSFGASFLFDRINIKATKNNQQNTNPYKLLIQLNSYINTFIFGFFSIITLLFIILLIFFT